MSHNKLRTEKSCLNCGHLVEERYCPNCGQENIEIHDSTFHLLLHFVQDIFHYDGKLWHTFRNLIRKPGLVAADYLDGKRVHNIQPIRFYFFTSTLFFLLLFYFVNPDKEEVHQNPYAELNKRMYFLKKEKEHHAGHADTLEVNKLIKTVQFSMDSLKKASGDTTDSDVVLDLGDAVSNNPENLDSMGWFERILYKRTEERRKEVEEKNQGDGGAAFRDLAIEMFHKLPQLIFLSLPFFALFLKMLYFRSKRRMYVEHLIFSIYQYSYLYALLIIFLLINYVTAAIGSDNVNNIAGYIRGFIILYLFIYLMLAMKRFYVGRWRYLLPKYFILMFLMSITILCLAALVGVATYLL
jgi:hypothetical protein